MYEEVGISSNNVPITLSIWYTERSSPTIFFAGYYVTPSHV